MISLFRNSIFCLVVSLALNIKPMLAQEKLYEQEPYDILTLKDGTTHKTFPLDIPNRRIPAAPRSSDAVTLRFLNEPDQENRVLWGSIRRIEFFEDRLLAEAARLLKEDEFDECFAYLAFLNENYPKTRGLKGAKEAFLQREAVRLVSQKSFERAWILLDEIYKINPTRKGLNNALERVLNSLFSDRIRARDFTDARRIFNVTQERYGDDQSELLAKWRALLERFGTRLLDQAREHMKGQRYREAYLTSRQLMDLWPETPGAEELTQEITTIYPIVTVAVTQPYFHENRQGTDYNYRAGIRASRLVSRDLFELTDIGSEGGIYECPVGKQTVSDDDLTLRLKLTDLQNSKSTISGLTIARELRKRSEPTSDAYDPHWSSLFEEASVENVFDLEVQLGRPHLKIESLLSFSLLNDFSEVETTTPFNIEVSESNANDIQFVANKNYLRSEKDQPREVIERHMQNSQASLNGLVRGEIDVIARILPADIRQIQGNANFRIGTYRLPSTHLLLPNVEHDFPGSRAFRSALLYSIDREKILKREILGGQEIDGCQIISGPFSPGIRRDDPIGYAYDQRIRPRDYDARLGKLRLQIALIEARNEAKKRGDEAPELPAIVLVHPNDEIPRLACQEIANQWRVIGVECQLRPLPVGHSRPEDDNWDFLYCDLMFREPLIEAPRFLAADGFAECRSPYLNLSLRQLSRAEDWQTTGLRLRAIHQVCFDDVSVLPLWQIVDHFVYRVGITGINEQPVQLYQNIEKWRVNR